jgi:hypothetical protein
MDTFECNGRWWLPGGEANDVAGTLKVSSGGGLSLSVIGSLGEGKNAFAEKFHPIILGSVDKGPTGNEVTLTGNFRTGATLGSFKGVRETYHAGRAYFGALLSDELSFSFKAMRLRLGGLKEWAHPLSGFDRKPPGIPPLGERAPLAFYTRREPARADVEGATVTLGLDLGGSISLTESSFREEAQVKVTCNDPISADNFIHRYGFALRSLMTFVCDRAQTIERFSVWRPDAPDREIVVVAELVQPEKAAERDEVSWHEMLFTLGEVNFSNFIGKWLAFTRRYEDACNVYFGLLYGPPSYLDMKFQNIVNAVHLYYERHPDGVARREEEGRRMTEVQSYLPEPERLWLYDHLGKKPRPPLRAVLTALLEKHGDGIDPLISGRRDGLIDAVLETLDYVVRRDREFEASAAVGADLYWLTEKLRFLLKACFLHEVGFSPSDVRECFRRNALFQHIYRQELDRESQFLMTPGAEEQDNPMASERATGPGLRPAGPGSFKTVWEYLESTPAPWRVIGIAAYFDESLERLLGERGESFVSKIATAYQKGLLTKNEHHDLLEIKKLRDTVAHSVGGPAIEEAAKLAIGRLKTWQVAVEAMPQYEQTIPNPDDRLLYVAAVILTRLENRTGRGGPSPLPEPELTDVEAWPPVTSD